MFWASFCVLSPFVPFSNKPSSDMRVRLPLCSITFSNVLFVWPLKYQIFNSRVKRTSKLWAGKTCFRSLLGPQLVLHCLFIFHSLWSWATWRPLSVVPVLSQSWTASWTAPRWSIRPSRAQRRTRSWANGAAAAPTCSPSPSRSWPTWPAPSPVSVLFLLFLLFRIVLNYLKEQIKARTDSCMFPYKQRCVIRVNDYLWEWF